MTTVEEVVASLREIVDPCSVAPGVPLSIADIGLARHVETDGDEVHVELR